MTPHGVWPAILACGLALLVWSPSVGVAGRRARALIAARHSWAAGPPRRRPPATSARASPGLRRWLLAGAAGLAAGLVVGGAFGVVVAPAVTFGVRYWLVRGRDDSRWYRQVVQADLPVACDLLAVCLAAGGPVAAALTGVGVAVRGPLGEQLTRVAGLYRLGAAPHRAWVGVVPELGALARTVIRAGESGSAVVPALQRLAADTRIAARGRAEADIRRAEVWVLAPLGGCFLPAFICLGVVPLVLGIAADVLG